MRLAPFLILVLLLVTGSPAAEERSLSALADSWIAEHAETLRALNQSIWSQPEVGLEEDHAALEMTAFLEGAGFSVERGVAGMPTAFVATAGSGRPIVGILAEYDALPGMSQAAQPIRQPRAGAPAGSEADVGHACGHSIFGAGSAGAAAAAWYAARVDGIPGTIRLYGTPAEETGIGKVYMAREGLFDDLDAALHWHPGDQTSVSFTTSKAIVSVKFRFEGLAAHASRSPHEGRSALDAVELMNIGVNFLREHVKEDARIHYVVTDGGGQPNVVPPRAEVWYYIRSDSHRDVERILDRIRRIAEGAALMTDTTMNEQIDSDVFEILPNRPLSELIQKHLERVGPPPFDERDRAFARRTQEDLVDAPPEPLAMEIDPLGETPSHAPASTDVGNVSWGVPTGGLRVASYTLGVPGHSWQIVACTGTPIGEKGMIVAARTLAGVALDLLTDEELLLRARADFDQRRLEGVPRYTFPESQEAPRTIR
jgi:aminobenzoyl-glutamate utilization protein B